MEQPVSTSESIPVPPKPKKPKKERKPKSKPVEKKAEQQPETKPSSVEPPDIPPEKPAPPAKQKTQAVPTPPDPMEDYDLISIDKDSIMS